jgi:hypothetical protein
LSAVNQRLCWCAPVERNGQQAHLNRKCNGESTPIRFLFPKPENYGFTRDRIRTDPLNALDAGRLRCDSNKRNVRGITMKPELKISFGLQTVRISLSPAIESEGKMDVFIISLSYL